MTVMDHMLCFILDSVQLLCTTCLICDACSSPNNIGEPYSFPIILDTTTHDAFHRICHSSPHVHPDLKNTFITRSMDLTEWLLAGSMLGVDQHNHLSFTPSCTSCLGLGPFQPLATALTAPVLVSFDISNFTVCPELSFFFHAPSSEGNIVYHLSVVLYFGVGHFTSWYIDTSGCCWAYDSQLHGGMMVSEGPVTFLDLTMFNNCLPSMLFFLHVS